MDANPYPVVRVDGTLWRPRVSGYDAPFSLEKSDSFTRHENGRSSDIAGQPAQPLFRDDASYWNAAQPAASVKVPNTGTSIQVLNQKGTSMGIKVARK